MLNKKILFLLFVLTFLGKTTAQTDIDGLMMGKRNLCGGFLYGHSAWKNYWEGTFYRDNGNIGTVSSNMVMAMANYGISDNLNIIAMAPWISNKASAGTLIGQQGIQDLTLVLKHKFYEKDLRGFGTSLHAVLGGSTPLSNYVADYLPLSIGMHSTNGFARLLADVQRKQIFLTGSATYMVRSNVSIDRNAYYTTEMIYSNKVAMPDVFMYNIRAGWRKSPDLYAELVFDRMNTLKGFDMRKNDMPFLSNNMEALRAGLNIKYLIPKTGGLSVIASGMHTLSGRNMGKATTIMAGLVYQAEFMKGDKK